MRHTCRSTKSPDGYRLVSWKRHKKPFRITAKLGAFGTATGPHKDFPHCLPRLVRSNHDLLQVGPPVPRRYDLDELYNDLILINWA